MVADRFQSGTSWRTLAGDLRPKINDGVIDAIEEEKGRCPMECCRTVLKKWCHKQRAHEVSDKYGFGLCELANNERTWTCEAGKYSVVRDIRSNLHTLLESGGVGLFICKAYYTHFKETVFKDFFRRCPLIVSTKTKSKR